MSRIFEITAQIQTYMPKADVELIQRAYVFAAHAHARQRRRSGELYITHPLGVAKNLVDLKLDVSSVVTGLLHDTVEDTHVTLQDIESRFGVEIASLVDGVTKVGKIHFRSSEHKKAENFRKMIMATAKDLRVLLVKLADRLHNMETLAFMSKEKRKRIAVETMEVYAPLAHRLGIHWVAQKMEDLSFAYIDPEAHDLLQQKLEGKLDFFEKSKLHIEGILHEALSRQGVTARVQGRMKNVYSLHQKMQNKSIDFDKIYDFIAFRVIVDEVATCYHVLGIIHGLYSPVPGRFKDYIALPKPNGYQSLHTVVIGPDHFRIEVQVRSEVMHNYSENGVATHWIYKTAQGLKEEKEREGFQWLQQLAETLHTADDPGEFLENVRLDLFVNEVYIFSRDAELFALPRGSTALDFAYAIHTDLGNHCIGLRVNDEGVELNQKLYNGDQVEVLTNPEQTPSRSWLQFVKTSRAKQSIGYWLRDQEKDAAITLGSHILNNVLGQASIGHEMLQLAGCSDDEQLKEKLGRGEIDVSTLLASETKLMSRLLKKKSFTKKNMQAASCCKPIPGDSVIGIFERGEGFMIHDVRCPKVQSEKAKWVEVNWKVESGLLYKTGIEVFCQNEQGSLSLVTSCLAAEGTSIEDLTIKQHPGALSSLYIVVGVRDRFHLSQVLKVLKALKHVSYVRRYDAKQVESEKVASRFNSALHRMTLFGQAVGEVLKEKTRFRKTK